VRGVGDNVQVVVASEHHIIAQEAVRRRPRRLQRRASDLRLDAFDRADERILRSLEFQERRFCRSR
jgi:hypothetical protein